MIKFRLITGAVTLYQETLSYFCHKAQFGLDDRIVEHDMTFKITVSHCITNKSIKSTGKSSLVLVLG